MHPRIKKSAFRKGEYIGYCNGAQRIRKGGQGWQTYALGSTAGTFIAATAPTLRQLGDRLCIIHEEEQSHEPQIICSLGLSAAQP